ncbi:hypothetical protein GGR47_001397 [Sphingomonas aquatilis]|uniref:Uncharacterized protein n=1 Tax=Sphingomonas aquatilis TaxID=93063 RepID=A0AAW3TRD9_9SPHN|nr:hypothetical protein [Sphingomonas aquatilis]
MRRSRPSQAPIAYAVRVREGNACGAKPDLFASSRESKNAAPLATAQ